MVSEKDLIRLPTEVDKYAGLQLRKLRLERGMSQRDLASRLGITFQQIQKYEKGLNRIGIGRLYDICTILEVKPSYFFNNTNNSEEKITQVAEGTSTSLVTELLLLFRSLDVEEQKAVINYIKLIKEQ
ncbi:helix-turn-helix domain-containing protein [Rickettsiales bacterium LUAb2]